MSAHQPSTKGLYPTTGRSQKSERTSAFQELTVLSGTKPHVIMLMVDGFLARATSKVLLVATWRRAIDVEEQPDPESRSIRKKSHEIIIGSA